VGAAEQIEVDGSLNLYLRWQLSVSHKATKHGDSSDSSDLHKRCCTVKVVILISDENIAAYSCILRLIAWT